VEEILNNMSFDSPLAKDMGTGLRSDYEGLSVIESARFRPNRSMHPSGWIDIFLWLVECWPGDKRVADQTTGPLASPTRTGQTI